MKQNYNKSISLSCQTCGGESFEFNEDKTYVKCTTCNREYHGGYEELKQSNEQQIDLAIKDIGKEFLSDIKDHLKQSLRGNKFIKFK